MGILQLINIVSLILAGLSFIFTAYLIYMKIRIRNLKEYLVSKIISMMEKNESNEQIVSSLMSEGYRKEDIGNKMFEIKQLMSFRRQNQ